MAIEQPISSSLVAQTHKAHYKMHKYWSRKPANIVREYIQHYTQPGDIVADPFLGSGVTFIESILSGRKSIGSDLSRFPNTSRWALFLVRHYSVEANVHAN